MVLDTDWYAGSVSHGIASADFDHRSPFNDSLIASGSDDGKVLSRSSWIPDPQLRQLGLHLESP